MIYSDRADAGRRLAQTLRQLNLQPESSVLLALPRGGVPVAFEVSKALHIPMEVMVVRKIGAPIHKEFGIGAICEGGFTVIDKRSAMMVGASEADIRRVVVEETAELERRRRVYRGHIPDLSVYCKDRNCVLVDDGLATGVTAEVCARALKAWGAGQVILAVPVGAPDSVQRLKSTGMVDAVVCPMQPQRFNAVGQWYDVFDQTEDDEVLQLLADTRRRLPLAMMPDKARRQVAAEPAGEISQPTTGPVRKEIDMQVPAVPGSTTAVSLQGYLWIPANAVGIVVFAHGSGSGRNSPRNQQVAAAMNQKGVGTLLFDLLTVQESSDRSNVFNIPLLAHRLKEAASWLRGHGYLNRMPLGFFGASTGGGAALWAAADLKDQVAAVVSRGGRPDLAIPRIPEVTAPTLLMVGGNDYPVIGMNEEAKRHMTRAKCELKIVPGATHLFEEPGTLEQVQELAADWFYRHMAAAH